MYTNPRKVRTLKFPGRVPIKFDAGDQTLLLAQMKELKQVLKANFALPEGAVVRHGG